MKHQALPFSKYQEKGSYHYDSTIGATHWRRFDIRSAARYQTAVKMMAPRTGELILDAGSGEGVAALLCCSKGASCIAVELEPYACELGKAIRDKLGIQPKQLGFMMENLEALPLPDASVDGVISLEVIEHMPDVSRYLAELRRILRPGGRLVISTPAKRPDGKLQDVYHIKEFTANELYDCLSAYFASTEVFSAWPGWLQRFYDNQVFHPVIGKVTRSVIKLTGYLGFNTFVGPCSVNMQCPLLLALARKTD